MTFPTFLMRGLRNPLKFLAAVTTLTALPACSSLKYSDSPLPVEARQAGGGQVLSFHAHESSDRLYISGSARKHRLSNTAHVDIQLIGSSGEIIAEEQNDIVPVRSAPGGGKRFTDSYVASFPLSTARQAAKVRVVYHSSAHPNS